MLTLEFNPDIIDQDPKLQESRGFSTLFRGGGGVSSTLALSKFNYSLLLIEEHVCYQELFKE